MKLSTAGMAISAAALAVVTTSGVATNLIANSAQIEAQPEAQLNIKYSGSFVSVLKEVDYTAAK